MSYQRGSGVVPMATGPRGAPVTWTLIAINVVMLVVLEATGGSDNSTNLIRWGAKHGPSMAQGEWWRFVTPIFLHAGLFHIIANTIGLIAFGATVERIFGRMRYLAIYLIAGVLGNVASLALYPSTISVGASGAVFGIIGAYGAFLLMNREAFGQAGRQALMSVGFIVVINLIIGFTFPGVDNAAHLGGLIGGAAMGWALSPRHRAVVQSRLLFFGPSVRREIVGVGESAALARIAAGAAATALLAYLALNAYRS